MCAYARYWNIHSFNIHDLPIAFPTKLPSEVHHCPHYVSSGWRGDFSPDVPTYRCPAASSWVVPQSVRRNVLNPAGSLVLNRAGAPGKTFWSYGSEMNLQVPCHTHVTAYPERRFWFLICSPAILAITTGGGVFTLVILV